MLSDYTLSFGISRGQESKHTSQNISSSRHKDVILDTEIDNECQQKDIEQPKII